MSRTSLKVHKRNAVLFSSLAIVGLTAAILSEVYKTGANVFLSSIGAELCMINPHRTHRELELHDKPLVFKIHDSFLSLLRAPYHSFIESIAPKYEATRHIHFHIPYKTKQLIDNDRATAVKSGTLV